MQPLSFLRQIANLSTVAELRTFDGTCKNPLSCTSSKFWRKPSFLSIKQGNAGLIRDRTDPDAGMPMPDWGSWQQEIMPAFQHLHMIFQYHIERVHPFLPPAVLTWKVYPYPPPTVWTCSGTGLRYRMPECRCRGYWSRCRCPVMLSVHCTFYTLHSTRFFFND